MRVDPERISISGMAAISRLISNGGGKAAPTVG